MTYKSFLFRHSKRLQQAQRNAPPLAMGETSQGVALYQTALLQIGHKMPISIKRNGLPDGIFGEETRAVTKAFQAGQKLNADGVAGRKTLTRLDELLAKDDPAPKPKRLPRPKPVPPVPPAPVPPGPTPPRPTPPGPIPPGPTPPAPPPPTPPFVPPDDKHYKVGTDDPPLGHDDGAGPWNSKPKQLGTRALHATMTSTAFITAAMVYPGADATRHLMHYNNNTGRPLTVDVVGMLTEVPSNKTLCRTMAAFLRLYVEKFPLGSFDITTKNAFGGYNEKAENANWFFAVGGFTLWMKGKVTITEVGGVKRYAFDGRYHMYDRYNWDGGKKVDIMGVEITDEAMGEFHRQGLSQEYDEVGSCPVSFSWTQGTTPTPDEIMPKAGR